MRRPACARRSRPTWQWLFQCLPVATLAAAHVAAVAAPPVRVAMVAPPRRPAWCGTVTGKAERAYDARTCGFVR